MILKELKDSWALLSSLLFDVIITTTNTIQSFMESTGKDLSIQDIICLSEELKTNTITTKLDLGCLELKNNQEMKKKKRNCQCEQTIQLGPGDPKH